MGFQLDTSGFVACVPHGPTRHAGGATIIWRDLSPFTQGYVKAALAASVGTPEFWENDRRAGYPDGVGFSDLAPESLAQVIADCERGREELEGFFRPDLSQAERGAAFWRSRQERLWSAFPPLTLYLGDDGRIYAEAQS